MTSASASADADDTDMTPAEFKAAMDRGIPSEIVTSREEYLRRLDEIAGVLGPDWCEGMDPVDWVRRQRDE